jgi:hypothetical protein
MVFGSISAQIAHLQHLHFVEWCQTGKKWNSIASKKKGSLNINFLSGAIEINWLALCGCLTCGSGA